MASQLYMNPSVAETRRLVICLVSLIAIVPLVAADSKLPPINPYPKRAPLTGKFIWFDLVTDNVKTAKQFYHDVLGWECETLGTGVDAYTVIRHGGRAIGGIVYDERPSPNQKESQWIGFISVPDVKRAERAVTLHSGQTRVAPTTLPGRGKYAVFAVCQSSTGDPPDYQPQINQWLWAELWSVDPAKSAKLYQELGEYSLRQNPDGPDRAAYHLRSQGFARAGVVKIPDPKIKPGWLYYVRVKDVLQTLAAVKAQGGRILLEPDANSKAARVAIIEDPTGAPLGLAEWNPSRTGKED